MMNRSIRFQMLALAALTAGPILALVGGNLWFQWQSDRAAAIEQAIGDARLLAAQIDDHIGNLDNLLLGLSRAVSTNAADMTANDRLLRQLKSELPNFISNIQLFSLEGVSIGSSLQGERTVVVDRPYFQQVMSEKRLVIGDVIRARGTNEWIVVIARPVEDQGGRLRAVLAIGTRLEQFQSIVRIEQFPKDTVLRIVDQRGIVVTQSANGPNWIGRDLSTSEIIKRHLAAKEASEVVEWSDGISRVTGSATAHRAPWLVSIGLPSSIQFERVASKLYWHACLICVVLLVAFGTAWFISGRITRPLRQLQTDALILAQGQLNHRTSVSRRDEIGTLAVTFNQMATAVERRDDESRHAANELRRTQGFLDAVIENIPTMLFVKDPKDCRFILINNAGEKLLGYSRTSLIGKNDYDFFPKEEADLFIEKDRRALQSGKLEIIEDEPIHTKTNGLRFLRTKKMPIMGEDGKPQYLLGLSEDITEQKRLQETERQAKETLTAVIDASPVAIICLAPDRSVMVWSRAAEQLFGYASSEVLGKRYKLIPLGGEDEFERLFQRALAGDILRNVEVRRRRKDGSLVDVSFAAAVMHDAQGAIQGVAYAVEDITERKRMEDMLRYLAHYDQLTSLPNRVSLQNDIQEVLKDNSEGAAVSLAILDLDGFKDVNDTLGHSAGDRLLAEVARRLTVIGIENSVKLYRLGGDEFVVVFSACGDPRTVDSVLKLIQKRIAEPIELSEQVVYIEASAGVAIGQGEDTTFEELLANADLALYDAKASGKRQRRFFTPTLRSQAHARHELDLALRRAFSDNQFELYFQPQIRLVDSVVVGAEALLRWHRPEHGIVAPGAFIDALARSPIAPSVGSWILRTACETAANWRNIRLGSIRMGVNLFPVQFHHAGFVGEVEEMLSQTDLPPELLELEITENIALGHDEKILAQLRALKTLGVGLAFDDFGTGYASLSYLTNYPLTRVKIDQSFVRKITDKSRPEDLAIVRSIISMAQNLNLAVTAEGIETNQQLTFLRVAKCEEAQGYLYAKPLPAAEFVEFVRASHLGTRIQSIA